MGSWEGDPKTAGFGDFWRNAGVFALSWVSLGSVLLAGDENQALVQRNDHATRGVGASVGSSRRSKR